MISYGTQPGDHFLLLEIGEELALQTSIDYGLLLEESLYVSTQIMISFPKTIVYEDSSFTATLSYRDRELSTLATPTTVHYRVDCLSSGRTITDWTAIAVPDTTNTVNITPTMNDIKTSGSREYKQLVVQTDRGTDTQVTEAKHWQVINLQGLS